MAEGITVAVIVLFVVEAAIVIGLSMALSAMIASVTRKSPEKTDIEENARGYQINTTSSMIPARLIYGRTRVGINRVYMGVSGTDNKYLHIIGVIGEGPVNGIAKTGGVDQLFLNEKLYTEYSGLVYYEFFTGTSTQTVCTTLQNAISEWNDPLRYTAYIYLRLEFNRDVFQQLPEFTMEIEGLKIYNPDTAVTEYSRNPALVARDFLTRSSRRGGMGYASSRISDASIIAVDTYCDAKGWTCDLVLGDNAAAVDNFQHILACFRGELLYSDNIFKLKYRDLDYESNVMALTEDDVIEQGKSTLKITQPSLFDTPNAVLCKYSNIEKHYQIDDYILSDSIAIAADGDYREKTVNLYGVSALSNVQKMANYFLERERINKTATLLMGTRGMALEPLDLVTLTHSRPGWSAKQLRVASSQMNYNGEVALALLEESADMYDDEYNISSHDWHDSTLPDPSMAVPDVRNVTHSEEVYHYRDRSFTRWKIDFDPPSTSTYPFWDYADIYVSTDGTNWKFMTKSGGDFMIDPVEEGMTYYCRIVSVSIFNTRHAFADAYTVSKTILGKVSVPDDVAAVNTTAHGDNVAIFAEKLADPDVAGYEIRLGAAWAGGIFIGFNETPNLRLAGVRPGTHTFWMAAKDNSGNYSDTPVSNVVEVFYPPGYVDIPTVGNWAWDFDAIGTFSNTEHCTFEAVDALKCSHTGNVLTGTWLSPEYDLGSIMTVRIWGDFNAVLDFAGGTWASLAPSPALWSSLISSTTKWKDILSPEFAGIIQAKLLWGDTTGNLVNETDYFEILAPEINGRFVQVEITIIDPDLATHLYLKTLNMKAAYWS